MWSVTRSGRTDRAVGWLAPFYELDTSVLRAQRDGNPGTYVSRGVANDKIFTVPVNVTVTPEPSQP